MRSTFDLKHWSQAADVTEDKAYRVTKRQRRLA
jgi:hypothetical protein